MADKSFQDSLRDVFGWTPESALSPESRVKGTFFDERGFQPREFQKRSIELIASGSNLLLVAGTAQGKTEAVIVPVAAMLLENARQFACCYVAPTRALLNDLYGRLEYPLRKLGLRVQIRHGDKPKDPDEGTVDVLLTTPESLDVLMVNGADILRRVRVVIVDEVHQIYGTPRGAQLVSLLERLKWTIAASKDVPLRRIGLSATVGDPTAVANWLSGSDRALEVLSAPAARAIEASVKCCTTDHELGTWMAESGHRKLLVFANSRVRCEQIASELAAFALGEISVHYSDLDVSEREFVERRFRQADQAVCVATGTLELGIDIGGIDAVVLADPAFSVQAFLQRIGRGARTRSSVPVLLQARSEVDLLHQLALLSLAERGEIEGGPYSEWFSVIAQQALSIVAGNRRRRVYEKVPSEIFGNWAWFDQATSKQLLDGLVSGEFLVREESVHSYRQGRNLALALENWGVSSNIDGVVGGLPILQGRRRLGMLSTGSSIQEGEVMRYGGRYWRVLAVSDQGIRVEPSAPTRGARLPRWAGRSAGGLSRLVAREIQAVLLGRAKVSAFLHTDAEESLEGLRASVLGLPSESIWEVDRRTSRTYYTFAGHLQNEVFRLLMNQRGMPVRRAAGGTLGGIALESEGALGFGGADEDEVRRLLDEHWRTLQRFSRVGPFFDSVPARLRRREVLAQVDWGELIGIFGRPRPIASAPGFSLDGA